MIQAKYAKVVEYVPDVVKQIKFYKFRNYMLSSELVQFAKKF